MRVASAVLLVLVTLAPAAVAREPHRPVEEARARVEHHLKAVSQLTEHFETVLKNDCPRFDSRREWRVYLDSEIDRVVLLLAHLEEAWIEAKHTDNDDVRRTAKAPRKRVDQARVLLGKLQGCAESNGASFSQTSVWRRIERDVPQRQSEIALPQESLGGGLRPPSDGRRAPDGVLLPASP